MGTVKFAEPISVERPAIVAIGTGKFGQGPRNDVVFSKPIQLPYHVFIQPDAGFQGRNIAPLAVTDKTPTGFAVRSIDGNSRAEFSWMVVR